MLLLELNRLLGNRKEKVIRQGITENQTQRELRLGKDAWGVFPERPKI